jgi:hypothetical protein
MARAVTCFLEQEEVSVAEALRRRDEARAALRPRLDFRCTECREPVRPHKDGSFGAAHLEHLRRNPACGLSDPARG